MYSDKERSDVQVILWSMQNEVYITYMYSSCIIYIYNGIVCCTIILPLIFEPQSRAGGFHLTVITSGSSAGSAITKYGFPGADGGPVSKRTYGNIYNEITRTLFIIITHLICVYGNPYNVNTWSLVWACVTIKC